MAALFSTLFNNGQYNPGATATESACMNKTRLGERTGKERAKFELAMGRCTRLIGDFVDRNFFLSVVGEEETIFRWFVFKRVVRDGSAWNPYSGVSLRALVDENVCSSWGLMQHASLLV